MTKLLPSPKPGRRSDHGVTLIEMMVVLVIVAVMAGLAMSGLAPGSAQKKLTGAVEVLVQKLALASDEAMVTGRPLGIDIGQSGYGFVQWQGEVGWQPVATGPLAMATELGGSLQIEAFAAPDAVAVPDSPYQIAPDGDGAAFTVEMRLSDQRRRVFFDGLNARQVSSTDPEAQDG